MLAEGDITCGEIGTEMDVTETGPRRTGTMSTLIVGASIASIGIDLTVPNLAAREREKLITRSMAMLALTKSLR